jgi:hypothetical protein
MIVDWLNGRHDESSSLQNVLFLVTTRMACSMALYNYAESSQPHTLVKVVP